MDAEERKAALGATFLVYNPKEGLRTLKEMIQWRNALLGTGEGAAAAGAAERGGADTKQAKTRRKRGGKEALEGDDGTDGTAQPTTSGPKAMQSAAKAVAPPLANVRNAASSRYPSYCVFVPAEYVPPLLDETSQRSNGTACGCDGLRNDNVDFASLCLARFRGGIPGRSETLRSGDQGDDGDFPGVARNRKRARQDELMFLSGTDGLAVANRLTFYCPPYGSGVLVSVLELHCRYGGGGAAERGSPTTVPCPSGGGELGLNPDHLAALNAAKPVLHQMGTFEILHCVPCVFRSQYRLFRPLLEQAGVELREPTHVLSSIPGDDDSPIRESKEKEQDGNGHELSFPGSSGTGWMPFCSDSAVFSCCRLADPSLVLVLRLADNLGFITMQQAVAQPTSALNVWLKQLPTFELGYHLFPTDVPVQAAAGPPPPSTHIGTGADTPPSLRPAPARCKVHSVHRAHWTSIAFDSEGRFLDHSPGGQALREQLMSPRAASAGSPKNEVKHTCTPVMEVQSFRYATQREVQDLVLL